MYDARLYQKACESVLRGHARRILDSFGSLLKWRVEENILDVGCGEGSTTVHLLQRLISENAAKYAILAVDLSDEMINVAKQEYSDQHVKFEQADVLNEHIWVNFKEHFHKVFSMLCLMIVPEIKVWTKNIYNVLKPNGQIFFTLALSNPMLKQHFSMCEQDKWSKYLKNNPFFYTEFLRRPDKIPWVTNHLKEGGFRNITYHVVTYESPIRDAKSAYEFIKAFTSMYENLPTDLREEYLKEISESIEGNALMDEEYTKFSYAVIVAEK